MARVEMKVKLVGEYQYDRQKYAGYGYETVSIYKMTDDDGTIYVWKTTSWLAYNDEPINRGSVIVIAASVKGQSKYNGEAQTELTRVKVKEVIEMGKSIEQIQAEREQARKVKRDEQMASLKGEDFVWTMPYKQYKERYADCETVIDSFVRPRFGVSHIDVIIREGRLKASGVRGKHFHSYALEWEDDGKTVKGAFVAVDFDHAVAQFHRMVGKDVEYEFVERYW